MLVYILLSLCLDINR